MQYINGLKDYTDNMSSAITFGKFDGLHLGHQMLVNAVKALGRKEQIRSIVCAFDMHQKGILMTKEERELHLENEVDYLVDCAFTRELRELEAETFIRDVIKDIFRARYVVVGPDFCFGHGKSGNVHMLKEYAKKYGYELIVIEKKRYHDRAISSTYIKEVLRDGNVSAASQMLGYRFGITGVVEHGRRLGRTLGFPTLNVVWPEDKLVPPKGVYLCKVWVDGETYDGIANIGIKPTVSEEEVVRMESYLFGYNGEAYGKKVIAELVEYVRAERKFRNRDELKKGVESDIRHAKNYFGIKN